MEMQITTSVDSEVLSEQEVQRLTEREHADAQIKWLQKNNWHFTPSSSGKPLIGRWYARMRLAGIVLPDSLAPQQTGMPNFDKVR